jgi:hypothetical protein
VHTHRVPVYRSPPTEMKRLIAGWPPIVSLHAARRRPYKHRFELKTQNDKKIITALDSLLTFRMRFELYTKNIYVSE